MSFFVTISLTSRTQGSNEWKVQMANINDDRLETVQREHEIVWNKKINLSLFIPKVHRTIQICSVMISEHHTQNGGATSNFTPFFSCFQQDLKPPQPLFLSLYLSSTFSSFHLPCSPVFPFDAFVAAFFLVLPFLY